ncbi:MAG: sugar ABC transporter permease [Lachnospiraceae bacterium]|nr:sugar ABC transporter permease [Lachnospiraceae bacterium]
MEKQLKSKKRLRLTLRQRDQFKGLFFVSPYIIGMIAFFIYPVCTSFVLSFSDIASIVGFDLKFVGIEHYKYAFIVDNNFVPMFLDVVGNTVLKFPLTIVFALIIAILLNKKIVCRGMFRVIFFIPFLLGAGVVMQQLRIQGVDRAVLSIMDGKIIPYNILNYFGADIVNAVQTVFGIIVQVLWDSGVQILLFLSGLQSISPALYEAAKIDGATEWEIFWKITIPMISPMMLLNLVYTLVTTFVDIDNQMLSYISTYGFGNLEFGYGAALGWIYFAFVGVLIALVFAIMKGYMHTNEVEEVKKRGHKSRRILTIETNKKRRY